jgi:mono/diheme cytochrome c family protein
MKTILTTAAASLALLAMSMGAAWAQGDAKDLYLSKCATCHGPDGAGKTARGKKLKVKSARDVVGTMSVEAMTKIVNEGKSPDMDGYGKELKPDQVKALVEYYRGLGK